MDKQKKVEENHISSHIRKLIKKDDKSVYWDVRINSKELEQWANDIQSLLDSEREKWRKETMKQVQIDLDNGRFGIICSNETIFKNYLSNLLTKSDE